MLDEAFSELKQDAAPGIDGLTWRDYEQNLERNLEELLHERPADAVQRLIIVLQPNTYVRPHHHSRQTLVLQQGRGNLLIFDGGARLMDRIELSPTSSVVQIPIGVWHGFVVLERNTAVLEIKPGPYRPNVLIGRQRKGTRSQIDLLTGPQMQHLERRGHLPNESFSPRPR